METEKTCKITNRSVGIVAYTLPDQHLIRQFYSRETKTVKISELRAVAGQEGGRELLYNYFYIDPPELVKEILNIEPEVEYKTITEANIDNWLTTSTLDEFKDALDFAPTGIKELIKIHSVQLPLNDLSKCEALKTQLGFDVLTAIKNEKATVEDIDTNAVPNTRRRAVTDKPAEESKKERRTVTK